MNRDHARMVLPAAWLLYNLCLALGYPFLFLYYHVKARTKGKYRDSFRRRLALELPRSYTLSSYRVWVHALSVGETLSVVPLVKALKDDCPELEILFSTATETGQAMARERLAPWVSDFFYMPHDFPWAMALLVQRLKPTAFVLVETDLWPNLLRALQAHQVFTVLVNGRISEKSFERSRRWRSLLTPLLNGFDLIFVQSLEDKARYQALGGPEERVHSVGNLKFDALSAQGSGTDLSALRTTSGIEADRAAWIAGSTHEGEETILLDLHRQLRAKHPDLLLILAPRHMERAEQLARLCDQYALSWARRSMGQSASQRAVYILDTLGELSRFYGLADVAFIGGSLIPFGGHNPLEAVAYEKPTFWGPHLSNFRAIEAGLLAAGCGFQVSSAQELAGVLERCLGDTALRNRMRAAARNFLQSQTGCSRRIAHRIRQGLKCTHEARRNEP